MNEKKDLKKVLVNGDDLLNLIHWAGKYVDMRYALVSQEFNRIYDEIVTQNPFLKEHEYVDQKMIENGNYFPYAKDGMHEEAVQKIKSVCF